jgi:transforming growth factor-beta-induced protein
MMRAVLCLASILSATADSLVERTGQTNIVELAKSQPDLSTLVSALIAGGLTDTLSGTGPFTVFAPTNEAFAKIEPKALQALLQNKQQLYKVLEYHVIAANFRMRELMAVKVAKTLAGDSVQVSDPDGTIKVNQAKVLTADVAASNGFVHIIDSVLMPNSLPPLPLQVDIVKLAQRTKDLSTLVAALAAGKLVNTLEGKGPFTVFAPTNEAFAKIPQGTLAALLKNTQLLDRLLEYHVLSGKVTARDLMAAKVVSTLEKEQLVVRSMSGVMVNNAKVVTADVGATNGVVHIIDHVLVPPGFPEAVYPMNIVELAEGQPDLATLVTAVVAGKLAPTLAGNGPFTVFAPTNEAFAKIPTATLQKLLADTAALDKVLEYHVLSGHFSMRDLMAVEKAQTLEGGSLSIMNKDGIQVNNATVLKADVAASNGIVHVIDSVLMPKTDLAVVV